MNVHAIVTTENSSFFRQHVENLSRNGVNFKITSATDIAPSAGKHPDDQKRSSFLRPNFGHTLPYYAYTSLRFYPEILQSSIKSNVDVVHAYSGLTLPFALAQPNRPLVVSFIGSDLMGDHLFGKFSDIAKQCANKADAVIVQNKQMADFLDCDSYILPNGVDFNTFKPIPRECAVKRVGWDPNSKHILFPYGTNRDVKNYELAQEVSEHVKSEYSDQVCFHHLGNVLYEEMPFYMNAADTVLITSKREGSPNTVKEALACNTPVVSTDVGDVAQRVENIDNSQVCDFKDELVGSVLSAIDDNNCNARDQIQDVSWESISKDLFDIYATVMDKSDRQLC